MFSLCVPYVKSFSGSCRLWSLQRRSFLSLILKPTISTTSTLVTSHGDPPVGRDDLQRALDHTVSVVRRHDPSGYLPGRLLTDHEDMQVTYFAVRSFWIETGLRFGTTAAASIPTNASGSSNNTTRTTPLEHLTWWKEEIDNMFSNSFENKQGSQKQHPTIQLLKHLQSRHDFNRCHFDDILTGRFQDLDLKQYPTLEALEEHAMRSCGSLMQLILESGGYKERDLPVAHTTARLLGKAHGLTNALRMSIPVMSTTGRLVIPQSLCERFGVKSPRYLLSALGQGDVRCIQALRSAVEDISNHASAYLDEARSLRAEIEREVAAYVDTTTTTTTSETSGRRSGQVAAAATKDVMRVFLPGLASETFLKRLEGHNFDLTDRNLRHVSWSEHATCGLRIMKAAYEGTY